MLSVGLSGTQGTCIGPGLPAVARRATWQGIAGEPLERALLRGRLGLVKKHIRRTSLAVSQVKPPISLNHNLGFSFIKREY